MEHITRSKAIRLKCLDCCGGQSAEVRKCPAEHCPLWPYRMGKKIKEENSEFSDDFEDNDSE